MRSHTAHSPRSPITPFPLCTSITQYSQQTDQIPPPPPPLERSLLVTKDMLRSLLQQEKRQHQMTKLTLKDTLNTVSSSAAGTFGLTRKKVEKQQRHLIQSLDDEKASVQASMAALRALSLETIKMQYAMLPSRYLLLVEGPKATKRELIARLRDIFVSRYVFLFCTL